MRLAKILKRTALVFGSLVILLILVTVAVLAVGVSVNIDQIRAKAEAAASRAIDRNVSIDGHLSLELSFRPALELEGLKIANPPTWDTDDFVNVKLFRAQIRVLPLADPTADSHHLYRLGTRAFESDGQCMLSGKLVSPWVRACQHS